MCCLLDLRCIVEFVGSQFNIFIILSKFIVLAQFVILEKKKKTQSPLIIYWFFIYLAYWHVH